MRQKPDTEIDLTLNHGEVHVLLGKNGAGKSTLIGILSGMVAPDSDEIRVAGHEVQIGSPRDALDLGIGTVDQHSLLVPTLSVLDNMMLGTANLFKLDAHGAAQRLSELTGLLNVEMDPDAIVGELALGERQQVEIVRALWRGERVLILDEPTSMLTPNGVKQLGEVVRRLSEQGLAVVFITHKLNEALEFGDRISVLRRGNKAGQVTPDEMSSQSVGELKELIIELIFGGSHDSETPVIEKARSLAQQPVYFRLDDVTVAGTGPRPLLDSITLSVRRGEIFGIAGIDGNGQKVLAEVIAGQRKIDAGEVTVDGREVQDLPIAERQKLGIRYVTDDRHGEGSVGELSIALNAVLKWAGQRPFWRWTRVRHALINEFAAGLIADHDVRAPHEGVSIATLSGGNMQKVVVGRELAMGPRLVVYNKPTYGIDVKTIRAVLAQIVSQSRKGTTAILISTELDELISTCDRIAVMSEGRIEGIIDARPGIETELGEMMTGASNL